MSIILKKIPIFLIILFSIASCKKDGKKTTENYMQFVLDGVQVKCDGHYGATPRTTIGPDANIIFYAGWGNNAIDFQLFTQAATDIAPGQYVFGPGKAYVAQIWPHRTSTPGIDYSYIAGSYAQSPTIAGSGQITIIEINGDYIKGSFDFITGINSNNGLFKTVTDGQFLISRR